jgi:putative tryptophan/tyrosine transport system substrate-binding protein
MRRREFIAGLGSAAAWPLVAQAQRDQIRRLGVLMGWSESDPQYRADFVGFREALAQLGWTVGSNLSIEQRWTNAEFARIAPLAKELVALNPDVILSSTTPVTAALHRETNTIPIVFAVVSDPVGAGLVASLPRPGGNITGFINVENTLGGKWLGLLKEVAPRIKRAGLMFNPDTAPGGGSYFLRSFQDTARALAVEPVTMPVRSDTDIDIAIDALAGGMAGLVAMSDSFISIHRRSIISAAARNNVATINDIPVFVRDGGLLSYGPLNGDLFRRAAGSVDRILRGAKPAELPVQLPTKFELAINLKTAKALGLTIPETLLATADEVIQ